MYETNEPLAVSELGYDFDREVLWITADTPAETGSERSEILISADYTAPLSDVNGIGFYRDKGRTSVSKS